MKWLSLVCLVWIAPPVFADSEAVDEHVWREMISACHTVRHDNMWHYNQVQEKEGRYEHAYPPPVQQLGDRIERCQNSVRRRIVAAGRQCEESWFAKGGRNLHRDALNVLNAHCPGQYAALLDEYERCCAVIPGY